jgi:hypothetical protein
MAAFMVRVELHGADWEEYNELHVAMEREGFKRTILADNGVLYQLPPAEYRIEGYYRVEEVLAMARRAANTINRLYAIIASQVGPQIWVGLEVASYAMT